MKEEKIGINVIPTIKLWEFVEVNNSDTVDCFFGIDNEAHKELAVEMIENRMKEHSSFKIHYDFRVFTKHKKRDWSYINNVMIYENKD